MSSYYYLDVQTKFHQGETVQLTPSEAKETIRKNLKELFGECGTLQSVEILKSYLKEGRFILRKEGKDLIIFATAEDHKEPSKVVLPEPEPQPGLILPDGGINWNCPCLGGMATGPCGVEFREAFSCFHNSEAEPKGSDCYDAFREMHLCMAEYPALYNKYDDDEKDLDLDIEAEAEKKLLKSESVPSPSGNGGSSDRQVTETKR